MFGGDGADEVDGERELVAWFVRKSSACAWIVLFGLSVLRKGLCSGVVLLRSPFLEDGFSVEEF